MSEEKRRRQRTRKSSSGRGVVEAQERIEITPESIAVSNLQIKFKKIQKCLKVIRDLLFNYRFATAEKKFVIRQRVHELVSRIKRELYFPNLHMVKASDFRFESVFNTLRELIKGLDDLLFYVDDGRIDDAIMKLSDIESNIILYMQSISFLGVAFREVTEMPIHEVLKLAGRAELPEELQDLPEFHKQVFAFIASRGRVSLRELTSRLSPEAQTVLQNVLRELQELGLIKVYIDRSGNIYYEPNVSVHL